jgi:hypothetical protein
VPILPIAIEDRLVVTDALGTAANMAPAGNRPRGRCHGPVYEACRRGRLQDVPRPRAYGQAHRERDRPRADVAAGGEDCPGDGPPLADGADQRTWRDGRSAVRPGQQAARPAGRSQAAAPSSAERSREDVSKPGVRTSAMASGRLSSGRAVASSQTSERPVMAVLIALMAVCLFAAGAAAGIIGVAAVAIRREERNLTLTSDTPGQVASAGRWLNGLYVRAPAAPPPATRTRRRPGPRGGPAPDTPSRSPARPSRPGVAGAAWTPSP